ncbi:MAG TPA: glycosyltransferase family 39 protein [Bacteroidia bacterium]|nr:glycosyltransferase family 39 protein [Bacteroidia bacterium]
MKNYAFLLFPVVAFLVVFIGFGFNGMYGQDAYEYANLARRIQNFLAHDSQLGHFGWPPGYPICGALLGFITENIFLAMQLVSTISLVTTAWFVNRTIRILNREQQFAGIYTLLFISACPFLMKAGVLVMSDMGCAACIAGLLFHAIKFRKLEKDSSLVWFFLFAAAACMFRYAAILLTFIPMLWLIPRIYRERKYLQLLTGIIIALVIVFPFLVLQINNPLGFLSRGLIADWSFLNYFRATFDSIDGHVEYKVPNIVYAFAIPFHPGFFIEGLLFLTVLFTSRRVYSTEKMMFGVFVLYALFIAGMPVQSQRFFVPALIFLLIPGYRGFDKIARLLTGSFRAIIFSVLFIFHIAYFSWNLKPYIERSRLEQDILTWISANTNQPDIYTVDMDISLAGNGLERNYHNLWRTQYDSFEKGSLVLVNPKVIAAQWNGRNPMKNWRKLNREYQLALLKSFDKGWELYEIR